MKMQLSWPVSEKPGHERNLAGQESEREAERHSNQGSQSEFEQRLKMDSTQCERQQDNHRNMDDIDGKGLLREGAAKVGLAIEEAAEEGEESQAYPHREGAVPERIRRGLHGSVTHKGPPAESARGARTIVAASATTNPTVPIEPGMVWNQFRRKAMIPRMKKLRYCGKYASVGNSRIGIDMPRGTTMRIRKLDDASTRMNRPTARWLGGLKARPATFPLARRAFLQMT